MKRVFKLMISLAVAMSMLLLSSIAAYAGLYPDKPVAGDPVSDDIAGLEIKTGVIPKEWGYSGNGWSKDLRYYYVTTLNDGNMILTVVNDKWVASASLEGFLNACTGWPEDELTNRIEADKLACYWEGNSDPINISDATISSSNSPKYTGEIIDIAEFGIEVSLSEGEVIPEKCYVLKVYTDESCSNEATLKESGRYYVLAEGVESEGYTGRTMIAAITISEVGPTPTPDPTPAPTPTPTPDKESTSVHVHKFVWRTITEPTKETDGLEGEVCSCGAVKNTQPLSAYGYALNEYATPMINAAKSGQTITFEFGEWNSFPKSFMAKLVDKSAQNVTFVFHYKWKHLKREITIPAGTPIDLNFDWYGPAKMAELYGMN